MQNQYEHFEKKLEIYEKGKEFLQTNNSFKLYKNQFNKKHSKQYKKW